MLGLTERPETTASPTDIAARAFQGLDRFLLTDDPRPVAVAVSGGGDSVALLAIACAWGASRGRPILALSVDHGLQPGSRDWSRGALETAERLGARSRLLTWDGDKPARGRPAAARRARHALIAEAAREAGARVALFAHTADDVAEGDRMRAQGSTLGRLRAWAPSPVWPEGRELFLLRPLLDVRREALRAYLRARGLAWVEDPANADPAFARARARAALQAEAFRPSRERTTPAVALCGLTDVGGGLALDRPALADPRILAAALLSAAGGERPPRRERLARLGARLAAGEDFVATLAGAILEAEGGRVRVARDAGEMSRGGLAPLTLSPGSVSVWDGRFEILVGEPGFTVVPVKGRLAALEPADRKAVLGLPRIVRPSLPAVVRDGEARPVLAARAGRVRSLAGPRLAAACGLIAHEGNIGPGVNGAGTPGALC